MTPQHRGDVDDAPVLARQHVAADLARQPERRDEVGLDGGAERFRRRVDDGLAVEDAGIVDQHVDAAMAADDGLDLLAHRRLVGDVERHGLGLAALAHDGAGG